MTPTIPLTPDGLPDLDKISGTATATASGSTAKTDIWNLPGDLNGKTIITQYGQRVPKGLSQRLDPHDVEQQQTSQQVTLGVEKDPNDPTGPGIPSGPYALPINMYSTNPKGYLQLQQALFAAGYFGSKSAATVRWGADTSSTMDAWTQLLRDTIQQQSLGHNVTWEDVLKNSAANAKSAQSGTTPQNPTVTQFTDPQTVKAQVQQASQASLGRNLSDKELEVFVSEFHAAQEKFGQQTAEINAAQTAGTGGHFDATQPELTGEADQYVKDTFGTEIAGNNLSDYVRALESMVGGV